MKEKRSSDTRQFLLTLLATTISIILTFGTSAIIDRRHKEAAKKEMVMMIIYDFDKSIKKIQYADSLLRKASKTQLEIALHPEYFDSLYSLTVPAITLPSLEFSETTEKVFSSNIETFNTLGNVNFVHEVSSFYNTRRTYRNNVLDRLKEEIPFSQGINTIEGLFQVDFQEHNYISFGLLNDLQKTRDRCIQMMKVSEDELKEFGQLRSIGTDQNEEYKMIHQQMLQEFFEAEMIINNAKKKLKS